MEIVPKRKWQYPISIEREYARLLTAYVDKELEIVEEFLPDMVDSVYRNSVHNDAIGDWLGNLVDRVQKKVKEKLTPLAAIRKTFQQVNKFVSTQMTETIKSLFGSSPRQFNNTRQFEMIQTIWTSQNLELVKSIDTQIMDKIRFMMSQRIIHAAEKPELKEQLVQEIQDLAKVARNRAALIAADQVGKLNSQLTQYRQVNAGVDKYMWVTMRDSRVRIEHQSRDGLIYKWSSPPPDGHPGWPIRCRCTAKPVIDTDKIGVEPLRNSFIKAPEGSIIKANKVITGHDDPPRVFEPYGVIDKIEDGHVYRTFYGADGIMVRQIHSDDHKKPKAHPYGKKGEHVHDYVWAPDGKRLLERKVRELTPQERNENGDLLWWKN